jgi:hypothetical protein
VQWLTPRVEIGRTVVQDPCKKFERAHFNKLKLHVVAPTCHCNYAESVNGKIKVQAGQGINARPYLKNI